MFNLDVFLTPAKFLNVPFYLFIITSMKIHYWCMSNNQGSLHKRIWCIKLWSCPYCTIHIVSRKTMNHMKLLTIHFSLNKGWQICKEQTNLVSFFIIKRQILF